MLETTRARSFGQQLAYEIVDAGLDCDLEFSAHAVCAADQYRVLVPCRLQVKYATESTNLGIGSRTTCSTNKGFYSLY